MGYQCKEELRDRARHLRKNPTVEERKLWARLRKKQLDDLRFRRQYVLAPFIVDFYCSAEKLAVEVDGASHDECAEGDEERDAYLWEVYEVRVVRVGADEVLMDVEGVLGRIREVVFQEVTP